MARRGRGTGQGEAALEINLTPLLDVVLQLITFFMMLVHFGTRLDAAEVDVRLPVAPAAMPGVDLALDRIVVAIDAEGRLLVEGESRDVEAADAWWARQAERRRAGLAALGKADDELSTVVIVRADRLAPYGSVRRAMATAQARGFANFTLVVLRERQP